MQPDGDEAEEQGYAEEHNDGQAFGHVVHFTHCFGSDRSDRAMATATATICRTTGAPVQNGNGNMVFNVHRKLKSY